MNEPTTAIVPTEGGNIAVTALLPEEMTQCQSALIAWAEHKIATLRREEDDLAEAVAHAKRQKWQTSTLVRHRARAEQRRIFYAKMKRALEAGYVIVPNFPVSLFAIRTDRMNPSGTSESWYATLEQKAGTLSEGEGEYQNPFPAIHVLTLPAPTPEAPERTKKEYYVRDWNDIEFPIQMAKPQMMEATSRAMALQIFDQFGILPEAKKKDPLIVAQLIDPRSTTYNRRLVTFMIAWHLDTRFL